MTAQCCISATPTVPCAAISANPSDFFDCSAYTLAYQKRTSACCGHYITTKAVRTLILETIRTVSTFAMMAGSKQDVANLLHEETEIRSVREQLLQKRRQQTPKKHRDS